MCMQSCHPVPVPSTPDTGPESPATPSPAAAQGSPAGVPRGLYHRPRGSLPLALLSAMKAKATLLTLKVSVTFGDSRSELGTLIPFLSNIHVFYHNKGGFRGSSGGP